MHQLRNDLTTVSEHTLEHGEQTRHYSVVDATSEALQPILKSRDYPLRASGIYGEDIRVADLVPEIYRSRMARLQLGIQTHTLVEAIDETCEGLSEAQVREYLQGVQYWLGYRIDQEEDIWDRAEQVTILWSWQHHIAEILGGYGTAPSAQRSSLISSLRSRLHNIFKKS